MLMDIADDTRRAIAEEIGANQSTVSRVRQRIGDADASPAERIGRDGKSDHDQDDLASEFELEVYLAACLLVESWERDDPRDRWRHTGERRPQSGPDYSGPDLELHRPASSTVDAFRIVAAAGDVERLKAWLLARPKDAPFLLALLESHSSC